MATIYDCSDNAGLLTGMRLARTAIGRGELVVLPTDTVYGVAADAFDPVAVQRLLDAKGRTRQAPPPVLVPGVPTLDALAEEVHDDVRALVDRFWPGGLTVIVPARSSLHWDLGETGGTVALRMPSNGIALELLAETGPLAVSSANLSGEPAAMTAADAERMLGDSVAVYLDGGEAGADYGAVPGTGSTIVDATALGREGGEVVVVREGVVPADEVFATLADARADRDDVRAADGPAASEPSASQAPGSDPAPPADAPASDPPASDAPASDPPDGPA